MGSKTDAALATAVIQLQLRLYAANWRRQQLLIGEEWREEGKSSHILFVALNNTGGKALTVKRHFN